MIPVWVTPAAGWTKYLTAILTEEAHFLGWVLTTGFIIGYGLDETSCIQPDDVVVRIQFPLLMDLVAERTNKHAASLAESNGCWLGTTLPAHDGRGLLSRLHCSANLFEIGDMECCWETSHTSIIISWNRSRFTTLWALNRVGGAIYLSLPSYKLLEAWQAVGMRAGKCPRICTIIMADCTLDLVTDLLLEVT